MAEVRNSPTSPSLSQRLTLDDHAPHHHSPDEPDKRVSVDATHHHLNKSAPATQLETLSRAYTKRNIKYARSVLERLTQDEPSAHSLHQNRIKLYQLAHPIQHYLALQQYNGIAPPTLAGDIEAIYGHGGDQLEFLLTQSYLNMNQDPEVYAEIEGDLSETAVFLLAARSLTDEATHPYLIIPSTEAQDKAHTTPDGLRHGFDFTVIRERDSVHIPLQVKTRTTCMAHYPEHILVVSVNDLVRSNNATPRMLAEALYFEISGAQHADTDLIEAASKRLFNAFDTF